MKNQNYDKPDTNCSSETLQETHDSPCNIKIPESLDLAVQKGIRAGQRIVRHRRRKIFCSVGGSMAAMLVAAALFVAVNPALANNLPFIRNIFAKIETQADIPGDYSKYAVNLGEKMLETETENTENQENAHSESTENSQTVSAEKLSDKLLQAYGDTKQNITITPQEVYCDGVSIFITLHLETRDPEGFGQEHAAEYTENGGVSRMQIDGYLGDNPEEHPFSVWLEGKSEEAQKYEGMMKIPADAVEETTTKLQMHVNFLFWLDLNKSNAAKNSTEQTGSNSVMKDGGWNLTIPVQIDRTRVKKYEVNHVNDQGFGIETVTVTPYEVQIESLIPDLTSELLTQLYSDYEVQCLQNLGEEQGKAFLANAYFDSSDIFWYGGFAVFNQNGTALKQADEKTYSAYGMENTTLYFYMMPDAVTAAKCEDQNVAKQCSIYSWELKLE